MNEVKQNSITLFGFVYYTVDGAFYVHKQVDMRLRKGVYRLEKGGFLEHYNDCLLDRHFGFGDIYDDTFETTFVGDIIMPRILDSFTIYSEKFVLRIAQRCIN